MTVLIILLGVLAGFLNTLAGGGSAITLPVLVASGVPAHIANGSNHAALLVSALTRISVFQGQGLIDWRRLAPLLFAAGLGAAAGTLLEIYIPGPVLARVALPVSATALLLVALGMRRFLNAAAAPRGGGAGAALLLFVIGAWAGLAAVGVGSLLLWALVLVVGYDTRMAAVQKSVLMLTMGVVALIGYAAAHEIGWEIAAPLSVGSIAGSWIGARFVVWRGSGPWIFRTVLVVAVVELALVLRDLL